MLNLWEYRFDDSFFCDKMLRRKYRNLLKFLYKCMCEVLDTRDTVKRVSEELKSDDRFT